MIVEADGRKPVNLSKERKMSRARQYRRHMKWVRYIDHNIKLSEETRATGGMWKDYDRETKEFYRKYPNGKPIKER